MLLLSPANRLLGEPDRLTTKVLEQVVLWVLLGVIVAIVMLWEKQSRASIGLRPLQWSSLAWGLLFAAVTICFVMPSLTFVAVGLAMSFFAWRRDLLANIVAHTIVDGMALVIIPVFSSVR